MTDQTSIANRALQKVGAKRISSLSEASREAQEVNSCYTSCLELELQSNFWTFSIRRVSLAALSSTPISGRTFEFQLPADFVRPAPEDPTYFATKTDYLYEGRKLLTNDPGPIIMRYVSRAVEEKDFHPLFAEALAAKIALEIAEPLTQSATKRDTLSQEYVFHISQARKVNAIIAGPIAPELDEWVRARLQPGNPLLPV